MFRVFSHDHDGYNKTGPPFESFEQAYAYARAALDDYAQRWGDYRYWRDALIEENGKRIAVVYPK